LHIDINSQSVGIFEAILLDGLGGGIELDIYKSLILDDNDL
jgi:hypothetical protein